jgi:predicted DNA-binding transcriptional regulator AlpA
MAGRTIPEGAKFLSPSSACVKFDRGRSWIWDRVRRDPTFPRPIYLDNKAPRFLESELEAWAAARTAAREVGGRS